MLHPVYDLAFSLSMHFIQNITTNSVGPTHVVEISERNADIMYFIRRFSELAEVG